MLLPALAVFEGTSAPLMFSCLHKADLLISKFRGKHVCSHHRPDKVHTNVVGDARAPETQAYLEYIRGSILLPRKLSFRVFKILVVQMTHP